MIWDREGCERVGREVHFGLCCLAVGGENWQEKTGKNGNISPYLHPIIIYYRGQKSPKNWEWKI